MRLIRLSVGTLIMVGGIVFSAATWLIPFPPLHRRCLARVRCLWAKALLWLLRVHVRIEPPDVKISGSALTVANHTGYLDILVIMSVAPGVFISREGIIWWPLIGQAVAICGTLFTDRRNRFSIRRLIEKIRRQLRVGTSVVFFPEGTSSNGDGLRPFKSSLFAAASGDGKNFPVRPLVLHYHTIGGKPVDVSNRDRVFWYGDMGLIEHLWGMLAVSGIDVAVKALPERTLSDNRGEFARQLREEMLQELKFFGTSG